MCVSLVQNKYRHVVVYLEGAVVKVLPDVGGQILVLLHVLLHGDFVLELSHKLFIDCDVVNRVNVWKSIISHTTAILLSPDRGNVERGCEAWGRSSPCGLESGGRSQERALGANGPGRKASRGARCGPGEISEGEHDCGWSLRLSAQWSCGFHHVQLFARIDVRAALLAR